MPFQFNREAADEAIGESIKWLDGFGKLLEENFEAIDDAVGRADAVYTSKLMRRLMMLGSEC